MLPYICDMLVGVHSLCKIGYLDLLPLETKKGTFSSPLGGDPNVVSFCFTTHCNIIYYANEINLIVPQNGQNVPQITLKNIHFFEGFADVEKVNIF